jgi:hypothetical protein
MALLGLLTHCDFRSEPIEARGADRQLQPTAGTVDTAARAGAGGSTAQASAPQQSNVSSGTPSGGGAALPVDAGKPIQDASPPPQDVPVDAGPACDAPACEGDTSCEATCQVGCDCDVPCAGFETCDASCGVDGDCTIDCSEVDECNAQCSVGSTCSVSCANANDCFPTCEAGADCAFDCTDTDDCEPICRAGSTCEAACSGADDCDQVVCEEGASCLLDCDGNNDCEFDECAAGETECDGDIRVCGRPCP